jgi:hypothetical protein
MFLIKRAKIICGSLFLFAISVCNNSTAQVSLRQEPHHKILLENEYVRLYDGHIPPGDTTEAHVHATNSVVLFLSTSTFGIQDLGERPVITKVNPGDLIYRAFGDKPVNHKVWNETAPVLHFMIVELLKKGPDEDTCSNITQSNISLILREKSVKVYNFIIGNGKRYLIPKSNCAHLLVSISGSFAVSYNNGVRTLQSNEYIFFYPQRDIEINGSIRNNQNSRSVLLDLE